MLVCDVHVIELMGQGLWDGKRCLLWFFALCFVLASTKCTRTECQTAESVTSKSPNDCPGYHSGDLTHSLCCLSFRYLSETFY